MRLLSLVIVIGTSVWVFRDARERGVEKDQQEGFLDLGPWGWFLGCLLVWIVVFPIYLINRPKLGREAFAARIRSGTVAKGTSHPARLEAHRQSSVQGHVAKEPIDSDLGGEDVSVEEAFAEAAATVLGDGDNRDHSTRLTNCPDCRGRVSRRAASCPHCGAPLAEIKARREATRAIQESWWDRVTSHTKPCSDCGHVVSRLASRCPQCGAPVDKLAYYSWQFLGCGCGLLALWFLLGLLTIF